MKRFYFFVLVMVLCFSLKAQEHAWVYFIDKPNEGAYLASPTTMLSQRALDRRAVQQIALDDKDVPIETSYYNSIKNTSGITILAKSKWLNALHVIGTVEAINDVKNTYSFVANIEFANALLNSDVSSKKITKTHFNYQNKLKNTLVDLDYGVATNQIEMLGGDILHEHGYTGEGMHIAVIDAGFPNVNTLDAFSRIRQNDQILGGYDFVNRSEDFYTGSSHGTLVLSDIAGYIDEEFIGTAPDASFYLFITEDDSSETPLEESLWVEAAERADSLGVNIINTSLGYTTFDNATYNYSYADMDGNTTFISRGATIGASKGMLLVSSAGNSGTLDWKYISAPADAENVFSIGAVNANEIIAPFSSFGPTVDQRIKPDVLALGQGAYVIDSSTGLPGTANGTSLSSPIIAGVMACFWQAFPEKTNLEIMQIIRESADRYTNPDDQYGYGVPDFEVAYNNALLATEDTSLDFNGIRISPNPAEGQLAISFDENNLAPYGLKIYSFLGETIVDKKTNSTQINIESLATGIYFLEVNIGKEQQVFKFMKK